jgi:hypothetical protein
MFNSFSILKSLWYIRVYSALKYFIQVINESPSVLLLLQTFQSFLYRSDQNLQKKKKEKT